MEKEPYEAGVFSTSDRGTVLVGMVDETIYSNAFKVSQVGSDSSFESRCSIYI